MLRELERDLGEVFKTLFIDFTNITWAFIVLVIVWFCVYLALQQPKEQTVYIVRTNWDCHKDDGIYNIQDYKVFSEKQKAQKFWEEVENRPETKSFLGRATAKGFKNCEIRGVIGSKEVVK